MSYVFLSYSREDAEAARGLRAQLEAAGVTVWQDVDLGIGLEFRSGIEAKLEGAGCVVVLWSPRSVERTFVREEAARGRDRLVQVCLDGASPPLGFRELNAGTLDDVAAVLRAVEIRLKHTVFITGAGEDLAGYRGSIANAVHTAQLQPVFSRGSHDGARIDAARAVIVVCAHLFPEQAAADVERARALKKPVIALVVDPKHPWPPEYREEHGLQRALEGDEDTSAAVVAEVKRRKRLRDEFRAALVDAIVFTTPESVRTPLLARLERFTGQPVSDAEPYLKWLEESTANIRIRVVRSKGAEPYFFGIDEIYIPLSAVGLSEHRVHLEQALTQRKLAVVGDPGAGKSTFLRRVAFELCRTLRDTRPADAAAFLRPGDRRFPVLLSVARFAQFLAGAGQEFETDSPEWVLRYLEKLSGEYNWKLDGAFFRRRCEAGQCLLLFDGLDEAPERRLRERMARIFEQFAATYDRCDFLVTTRPHSYEGQAVLEGFQRVEIGALGSEEIDGFLGHFAKALALNAAETEEFTGELRGAMARRLEVREMAANPVMLTALAVLQHNGQRLPEFRVQLYELILGWLAAARESKPGRLTAEGCLELHRRLALRMQDAPGGRIVQWPKRLAAEFLAVGDEGIEAMERVLEEEIGDSGILSMVGPDVRFWHLSFQEYLAAREIAGLGEAAQVALVTREEKLYRPEWRETMRLLGGVLKLQGDPKIEGFVRAVLGRLPGDASLAQRAPCVALLGAMMRDLKPMGYTPQTPDYHRVVRSVMGIFEVGESQALPLRVRIEAAEALGQAGDPRLEEDNWVTIPAGSFWMGAQSVDRSGRHYVLEAQTCEAPVHLVTLTEYRIGRYPVTVQEFRRFVDAEGYARCEFWVQNGFGEFQEPEHWVAQLRFPNRPVVGVSWFEASAYCVWANARLLTEAEWERAARGPQSQHYPWGDQPKLDGDRVNCRANGTSSLPTPIGLYPLGTSVEGITDMLGNVWEWTRDWCSDDYYHHAPSCDPPGPTSGHQRILRGGSWSNNPGSVRTSLRSRHPPQFRASNIGFRCGSD